MEEIIARYGFTVAQSRDLIGSNLSEVRYRQSKNLGGIIVPIRSGLVKFLSRIHLIGLARIIWRALVRILKS